MANELIPDIDPALQPTPEDLSFDLKEALRSIYLIRTRVPEDGFTAQSLGSERAGHAVLIDERGILLTIGYLVVCLLYTSPSPRDATLSRMPSSA